MVDHALILCGSDLDRHECHIVMRVPHRVCCPLSLDSNLLTCRRSMIKYDVILDDYAVVASMPAPRSNFASALLAGQGYVIGGFETTNTAARSIPKVGFSLNHCVLDILVTRFTRSCFLQHDSPSTSTHIDTTRTPLPLLQTTAEQS